MNIITEVTAEQEALIPNYIEKWKSKCTLTTPIFRPGFEQGIRDLHQEMCYEVPCEFIYYSSPIAMWRDFETWKSKITQLETKCYSHAVPLCDTGAYYRQWGAGKRRPAFNFSAKRYDHGPTGPLRETEDSDETSGRVIAKDFHADLWKRFDFEVPVNWGLMWSYLEEENISFHDSLWDLAWEEDSSTQASLDDRYSLSPQPWLLRELSCVDFCHNVLGISRNERLYSGLEAIVEHGSFCAIFGQLCVACERPIQIEGKHKGFTMTFRDGEVCKYIDPPLYYQPLESGI